MSLALPLVGHRPQIVISRMFQSGTVGVWIPLWPGTTWQDAARTTPATADGDPVGCADDVSPAGNHAKQSTSTSRPKLRISGSLRWLEFDGVDDYLATTAGGGYASESFAVAFRLTSLGASNKNLASNLSGSSGCLLRYIGASGKLGTITGNGSSNITLVSSVTAAAATDYVLGYTGGPSGSTNWVDQATPSTASTVLSAGPAGIGIGASSSGGSPADTRISGVLGMNRIWSAAERAIVNRYLASLQGRVL